jgi:hypothetical protein
MSKLSHFLHDPTTLSHTQQSIIRVRHLNETMNEFSPKNTSISPHFRLYLCASRKNLIHKNYQRKTTFSLSLFTINFIRQ